jgi:Family of unknown function (DUF6459)
VTVLATMPAAAAAGADQRRPARRGTPACLVSSTPTPDPRPLAHRLAQAIAEVLAGARPASQLSSHVTLPTVRLLERNAGRLNPAGNASRQRPIVRSVHLDQPRNDVAEACAVIDTGRRVRALALRLEAVNGHWRCTAVHIG